MIICDMLNDAVPSGVLGDVAEVRLGHPFRGAIPAVAKGSVRVVQIRDLRPDGIKNESDLLRTELAGRKAPDWLAEGDILLAARGTNPSATYLVNPPPRTVCSPHFYVIRVKQPNRLLPAFLAWQLNQSPAQRYLRQSAEGSLQLSIRRGVLEQVPIQIPPLDRQHAVIALARSAEAERTALEALIKNRESELALLAERLLSTPSEAA
jgi:hypothetical protein